MNTVAFVLIMTMQASGPSGAIDVPVSDQFRTRTDCISSVDDRLQALRKASKGPVRITLITYCEPRDGGGSK